MCPKSQSAAGVRPAQTLAPCQLVADATRKTTFAAISKRTVSSSEAGSRYIADRLEDSTVGVAQQMSEPEREVNAQAGVLVVQRAVQ
jgi:hypothetical protein